VRYDLGRGTKQMTYGPVIGLVARWELARPTSRSARGGGVNFGSYPV
jgi:hypothetical protein